MHRGTPTKFQRCFYSIRRGGAQHDGIAAISTGSGATSLGFGVSDVAWIISCKTGEKLPDVWDYRLIDTPLSHIDILYNP